MAKKLNYNFIRQLIARNLERLALILENSKTCSDVGPLRSAASKCKNDPSKSDKWEYEINRLILAVDKPKHVIPRSILDVKLTLDLSLMGTCTAYNDICHKNDTHDAFKELTMDLMIQGTDTKNTYRCTWHLDRHITTATSNASPDAHPHYHFQYGGKRMREVVNTGDTLLLDPPRIAHPPLDAILAIDFALSNYKPSARRVLINDSEYVALLRDAQKIFWRPYASIAASKWGTKIDTELKPEMIWPQLCAG